MNANIENNVDRAIRNAMMARPAPTIKPIANRVQDFFAAFDIGHPANRAKVATAIAHTLTTPEIYDALARLEADKANTLARYKELDAPACLIERVEKTANKAQISMLYRVLRARNIQACPIW